MDTTENGTALVKHGGAAVAKQDAVSGQIVRSGETSVVAASAMAEAQIRARYSLAQLRPRDWDEVRLRVMKECERPRFAQVARYSVPRGGKNVTGWSIRAAEALMRYVGNIDAQTRVVADDDRQRVIAVTVMDLEVNAAITVEVVVPKTVERRKLGQGQKALATRHNSFGDIVYLVESTDDELLFKQNNLLAKARRNAILQLVPGDLLDEMLEVVEETQARADKSDPDAARKKLLDCFDFVGVTPAALKEYIGKPLEALTPPDFKHLREVYAALRDGETTWREVTGANAEQAAPASDPKAQPKSAADLKAREKAKAKSTAPMGEPGGPEPPMPGEREPGEDDA